jgi:hypothetical protein
MGEVRQLSAALTIWLCNGVRQFTLLVSPDPLHEFRQSEHASGFHHRPLPLYPFAFNGIELGTLARSSTDKQAPAALVFGGTVVGVDPLLPRVTDRPGGLVPDEQESPFALGRKVCGKPCEKSPGHCTKGTPLDNTSAHGVRRGHVEARTGNRLSLWSLGWYHLFHQADGLVSAPGMPRGLGLTAPPDCIFAAQRYGRLVDGHLDQPVAAFCFSRMPGRD